MIKKRQKHGFKDALLQNDDKIIWILLINSITFFLFTIGETQILDFYPDTLYYLKHLPFYYWIGMGFNCAIFISLIRKKLFYCKINYLSVFLFIIILILYLHSLTPFIYNNPRIIDIYGYCSYAIETVLTTGYSKGSIWQWQHEYLVEFPGSTIFFSMIIIILEISPLIFAKYYVFVSMFILSLLIFALSKKITGEYALFTPIAYLSVAFVSEYNFAPQSHAFLMMVTFLLILISFLNKRNKALFIGKSMIILLWIMIVVAHPSTPIINMYSFLIVCAICIGISRILPSNAYFNLSEDELMHIKNVFMNLLYLFIVIYFGYIVYRSRFVFSGLVSLTQKIFNDLMIGNMYSITAPLAVNPSESYTLFYNVRWGEIISIVFLGLLSIFVLVIDSKDKDEISTFVVNSLFLGYISLPIFLVISGETAYGPERALIFGLIPFSIMFSMILKTELEGTKYRIFKGLLIMFIITSMLILPISKYGSDSYNFVSDSEFAGMNFVSNHPSIGIEIRDFCTPLSSYLFTNYWYNLFELQQIEGEIYRDSNLRNHKLYDSGQCHLFKRYY